MTNKLTRNFDVDVLRGLSIVLMVIFHFGYDLTVFGWADYNTGKDLEWKIFRAIIVSGFLLAVGMSFYLSYYQSFHVKKWVKGFLRLALVASLLSLVTYFIHPNAWIYFGIIHFIAVAFVFSIGFVRRPNLSALVAVVILVGWALGWLHFHWLWEWSRLNLGIPPRSVDLVRFFPWFALVLLGIFFMHHKWFGIQIPNTRLTQIFAKVGHYPMSIYLLHQPILYGLMWAVQNVFNV